MDIDFRINNLRDFAKKVKEHGELAGLDVVDIENALRGLAVFVSRADNGDYCNHPAINFVESHAKLLATRRELDSLDPRG
jgi:hypothetical protein